MVRIIFGIVMATLAGWTTAAASPPNLGQTLATQFELVAARPYDAEAHNDLGNLLVLDGRYEEAQEAYGKAIELAPTSTLPRFNLGMLLQQLGRPRDAVAEFRGLLEIDDAHARAHYQLGMLQEARRQRSAALESYARAFALDPDLTFPRHNPHIIDNRLATEAILMSRQFSDFPSSAMPRLYGEPERIADLMLKGMEEALASEEAGREPDETEEDELEPEEEPEVDEPARAQRAPATARPLPRGAESEDRSEDEDEDDSDESDEDDDDDDDDDDEGRRQLTSADLVSGSTVGQASGAGTPAGRRPAIGVGGRSSSTSNRERVIERRRRETTNPDSRATTTGRTPASGPRYRPASRLSTGRLELRLLPEEPAERLARLSK